MHRALPLAAAILVLFGCSWRRPPESLRKLPTTPSAQQTSAQQTPAAETAAPAARMSAEQLDDLVARVALYPDALLAIVLPASTQPLQIVEAARFLRAREGDPKLTPPAHWDEPVKSLLNYPEVVTSMNEDLTWLQGLGDAVTAQQSDVMDAIQRVRTRALAVGNLSTNEMWVVTQEEGIIRIESADPKTIYVPIYDPTVIYVVSSAPVVTYYPPYPCYWCPSAAYTGMMMGFGWYYHDIYYDHDHDDDIDIDIDHERPDRPDRPERPTNPDRPGRPERPQGPGRPNQTWKPTRPAGGQVGAGRPATRPAAPPSHAGAGATRPATGGPVGMDRLTKLPATTRDSYGGYERGRDATRDSQRGAESRGLSSRSGSSYGSTRGDSSWGGYDRGSRTNAWSSRGAASRSSMPRGGYGGGYGGGGGFGGGRGGGGRGGGGRGR